MMHICTSEHDRGAAITYCRFPIRGEGWDCLWDGLHEKLKDRTLEQIRAEEGTDEPLFRRIREHGAKRETIKLFADGTVKMKDKKLVRDGKVLDGPYDLTEEVNGAAGDA